MSNEIAVFKTPSEDTFEVIIGDNRYVVYNLPIPDHRRCKFISIQQGKPLPIFGGAKLEWNKTPQRVGDIVVTLVCNACLDALRRKVPDCEKVFNLLLSLRRLVETR